ncbi:type II toxin-antitoxin system RelE family toxin [Archaeoglobus sp.]
MLNAIERLSDTFLYSYEKLRGRKNVYRIVVGDYRIIYYIDKIVSVLLVDKRERIYDRL